MYSTTRLLLWKNRLQIRVAEILSRMGDPSILDTDLSFTSDPRITTSIVYNTVHTIRNDERKEKSLGGEFCQPAFCFTDTYIHIFRPSLQPRARELCCHSQSQCCFLHHKKQIIESALFGTDIIGNSLWHLTYLRSPFFSANASSIEKKNTKIQENETPNKRATGGKGNALRSCIRLILYAIPPIPPLKSPPLSSVEETGLGSSEMAALEDNDVPLVPDRGPASYLPSSLSDSAQLSSSRLSDKNFDKAVASDRSVKAGLVSVSGILKDCGASLIESPVKDAAGFLGALLSSRFSSCGE